MRSRKEEPDDETDETSDEDVDDERPRDPYLDGGEGQPASLGDDGRGYAAIRSDPPRDSFVSVFAYLGRLAERERDGREVARGLLGSVAEGMLNMYKEWIE